MNNLLNMKNNLIQNFYIIGASYEDIFPKSGKNNISNKSLDIINTTKSDIELNPKIISKFPPNDSNFNSIPDEIIVDHCFPNGLKVLESQKKDILNKFSHFYFELDNLKYNYLSKNKFLYSKVYFTCLKFNESLKDYQKLESIINSNINNSNNQSEKNSIHIGNEINDGNIAYIPKVTSLQLYFPLQKK